MRLRASLALSALLAAAPALVGCPPTCPAPSPSFHVLPFGDSITGGADDPTYPAHLNVLLGGTAGYTANLGASGETSAEGRNRWLNMVSCGQFPNAEVFVLLEGGGELIDFLQDKDPLLLFDPRSGSYPFRNELNALLAATKQNLKDMVQAAQAAGMQTVVGTYFETAAFLSCPASPIGFLLPDQVAKANAYFDELAAKQREVAAETASALADLDLLIGNFGGDPDKYTNCNHPSGEGNLDVALVVYDAIQSLP